MKRQVEVFFIVCFICHTSALRVNVNGIKVDFNISETQMCHSDKSLLKIMLDMPIYACVMECGARKRCLGLTSRRKGEMHFCKLLQSVDDGELSAGDCHLVRKSDIAINNLPCNDDCSEEKACDVTTNTCEVKECAFPTIDNGAILGNRNEIGSRLLVKCNPGFNMTTADNSMVCRQEGDWTNTPTCDIVPTEASSGQSVCVAIASTATDQWCMDNCNQPGSPNCPSTHCSCNPPVG